MNPSDDQFANGAQTRLLDPIDEDDTLLRVEAAGYPFPQHGTFRAIVESEAPDEHEYVWVKQGAGTTLLGVERGIENTPAVPHTAGARLTAVTTAESLLSLGLSGFGEHNYVTQYWYGPPGPSSSGNANAGVDRAYMLPYAITRRRRFDAFGTRIDSVFSAAGSTFDYAVYEADEIGMPGTLVPGSTVTGVPVDVGTGDKVGVFASPIELWPGIVWLAVALHGANWSGPGGSLRRLNYRRGFFLHPSLNFGLDDGGYYVDGIASPMPNLCPPVTPLQNADGPRQFLRAL